MSLPAKAGKRDSVQASYVTLNKDGKPVWEPGLRAEITSRRQHQVKRKADPDEPPISCDLKNTLKLPPEARATWLTKAIAAIPKGKAKAQEVFDIITHRKFASEVPPDLGTQMLKQVKESLVFFSEKQQLNIAKCRLVKEFKPVDPNKKRSRNRDDDDSDASSADDRGSISRRHFTEVDYRDDRSRSERRHGLDVAQEAGGSDAAGTAAERREEKYEEPEELFLSPEERARMEQEFEQREREKQKRREEELKRLESERKAHEEREKQRKAKIGNAFLMNVEEEEEPAPQQHRLVEKKVEDRMRSADEDSMGFSTRYSATAAAASSSSVETRASTTTAIQTMGGDSIVTEAQQILQRGAGAFLEAASRKKEKKRSRSKGRRARSRSRSRSRSPSSSSSRPRKGEDRRRPPAAGEDRRRPGPAGEDRRRPPAVGDERRRRTYDSLRSPTPDGHLRGQMRAARKAKMMAQMLQQGNVPRVA